jgi:hypothetical protein
MILVNRFGVRVVDEKANYNERTRVHYVWDPVRHEWTNLVLFMVYDQRTAELFGGRYPLPAEGMLANWVISAPTWRALAEKLDARLAELAPHTGGLRLAPSFTPTLQATIARWNQFADRGVDPDFQRGARVYDREWHLKIWSYPNPGTKHVIDQLNPALRPISVRGPFHAVILAPGTLDTNGGPVIDKHAQVLDAADRPIAGLYGAGNCVASPTGAAYYAGGGTLGPAVTYGFIAGESAARAPEKALS